MAFGFSRRFFGSIPKHSGDVGSNEDAFDWSPEGLALALSDGASESFDSRLWARILVRRFVENRDRSSASIDAAIKEFVRHHDPKSMSWSQHAAFERGSFATLLGLEVASDLKEAQVFAIGDTVALLLDGDRLVASFPYRSADEFQQRPTLLSSRRRHNSFLEEFDFLKASTITWRLDACTTPRIVCMTDAMGEWFLHLAVGDPSIGDLLLAFSEHAHLERVVRHERKAGRMRVDDSTVLIVE